MNVDVTRITHPIWLGGLFGNGYSPADASTYYYGATVTPFTTAPTVANGYIPTAYLACTIREIRLTVLIGGTNGTSETGTGYIRINNTTDTTIFNNVLQWDSATTGETFTATGLSIALAAGDFWTFKILHPTFTTNPTAILSSVQVNISIP